jgi:2-isopropylmalate synthase
VILQKSSTGDGPVDAVYKAIDKITGMKLKLADYSIRAISSGEDAQGEVNLKVIYKHATYSGKGTSTDIIEASAKAYLNAVNKIIAIKSGKLLNKSVKKEIL